MAASTDTRDIPAHASCSALWKSNTNSVALDLWILSERYRLVRHCADDVEQHPVYPETPCFVDFGLPRCTGISSTYGNASDPLIQPYSCSNRRETLGNGLVARTGGQVDRCTCERPQTQGVLDKSPQTPLPHPATAFLWLPFRSIMINKPNRYGKSKTKPLQVGDSSHRNRFRDDSRGHHGWYAGGLGGSQRESGLQARPVPRQAGQEELQRGHVSGRLQPERTCLLPCSKCRG